MNRAAVQVLAWGIYLAVLTVILWIWWPHWLSVVQLGGAAACTALIALAFVLIYRRGDRPPRAPERRLLPDLSPGAAITGIALAGMLYGAEFGFFLVLICAGLLALGLAQLGIELRSERRRKRGEP